MSACADDVRVEILAPVLLALLGPEIALQAVSPTRAASQERACSTFGATDDSPVLRDPARSRRLSGRRPSGLDRDDRGIDGGCQDGNRELGSMVQSMSPELHRTAPGTAPPDRTVQARGTAPSPTPSDTGPAVTIAEAARLAGVSEGALRKRVRRGTLPVVRSVDRGRVVQRIPLAALRSDYEIDGGAVPPIAPGTAPSSTPTTPPDHLRARAAALAAKLAERSRELVRTRDERDAAQLEVRNLAHAVGQLRERLGHLEALPAHGEPALASTRRARWGRGVRAAALGLAVVALTAGGAWSVREVQAAARVQHSAAQLAERARGELTEARDLRADSAELVEHANAQLAEVERERELQRVARVLVAVERVVLRVVGELLR